MFCNIWRQVSEPFSKDLPRLNAVYVKEEDDEVSFAYPNSGDRLGYCFDYTVKTGYNMKPKFKLDFAMFEFSGIKGTLGENRTLLGKQMSYPGMIQREFEYTNLGLIGKEQFGQKIPGSLTWSLDLMSRTEGMILEKKLYTVLSSHEEFRLVQCDGGLEIIFPDMSFYLSTGQAVNAFVFQDEFEMCAKLGETRETQERGHYLAIEHEVNLKSWDKMGLTIGMSSKSIKMALKAADTLNFEQVVENRWNAWFESLPIIAFSSEEEEKLYYKCWWTIKNNYYTHPVWGHSITEALPVYKGIWQWAIPSVEWHSNQNSEYTGQWIKKSMDLMMQSQREDGYITHAIYIDDKIPGERWLQTDTVQTPHFPWVAIRYYNATGDFESLKRWYSPLKKYYKYLYQSRDEKMLNKHLWAITTSFDTGLDTFPVFQRVTYGENGGEPERFCYASVMSAERFRYEQAMGIMADILGDDGSFWREEADKTRVAMDAYLWDDEKKWYGVRHEDGTLDTRVGVDGMFALTYGMVAPERAAQMESNVAKLIGEYGIRTMAADELGYREDVYWRGASWAKSCSITMAACKKFYPKLSHRAYYAILKGFLKHPGIWECYNARTGELARSDHGFVCTPGVTSNVGAGDVIGSLWLYHGMDMYGMERKLPLIDMQNIHCGGMRITIKDRTVTAKKAEKTSTSIIFSLPNGEGISQRILEENPICI